MDAIRADLDNARGALRGIVQEMQTSPARAVTTNVHDLSKVRCILELMHRATSGCLVIRS